MLSLENEFVPQDPPFTIKVELTEGCCLYCEFCGIRGIRKGPGSFKFLTVTNAKRIAKQIHKNAWTAKIEFTMHGEPTMNPNTVKIIKAFRKILPKNQMMMTSNGGGLVKDSDRIGDLFDAGLNILALDDYQHANFVSKVLGHAKKYGIPIHEYPQQKKFTPHTRVKVGQYYICVIRDISTGNVGTRKLSNHCGCAAPLDRRVTGRCARPFRELVIRWDLKVPICCNDWRSEFVCGDLTVDGIAKIWQGTALDSARKFLYDKSRSFVPCEGCDSVSYRVGLLPDKLGKMHMGKPERPDYELVKKISRDKPLTKPVLRPWEINKPKTLKDTLCK